MDYIVGVEERTRDCGPSTPIDQALLLVAQYRSGVDR
jgi:hypothetical protein